MQLLQSFATKTSIWWNRPLTCEPIEILYPLRCLCGIIFSLQRELSLKCPSPCKWAPETHCFTKLALDELVSLIYHWDPIQGALFEEMFTKYPLKRSHNKTQYSAWQQDIRFLRYAPNLCVPVLKYDDIIALALTFIPVAGGRCKSR